ncbi:MULTISPECIES: cupredoxin domain-containing protein [Lactiplantibacillus]|jgi:plastocyanin domain-containing protein|uniref:Cupredoxin domain-containing protein n=1 Tax=Lactiplantibacillus pentosus TaxID=1589 RepID=A0AAW8WBP9_LACPE|nr:MULTISPECIES: cupredoxin domain-containing protein [Lactiplantibacillus]MBU7460983.1 cupredoxin domain-containing protein [Lactiplantibacillus pentosus]MBU7477365.1 cupredoxin domain-containing protein [Lactiplantibacillus pentosus]MBU7483796.1 cupredoxin domain-containing protein [Lactiplantibacillus sp. 30.2.29]MBU7486863.1 cupredoxin domain-containing protein [Lactiplantibacillus pentosus]MBU7499939.1 cupredoxin domain-containing protein [Lactiplantibacillus pentosus]
MTEQNININVNGKYEPAEVTVKQGVPAQLTFTRTSTQGCLEHVHSTDLGFATDLPIDQPQTVTIPTDQAGEFTFSCGMDMVSGKVVVQG